MFFLSIDPNFLLLVEQLDVSPLLSPGFLLLFFFFFFFLLLKSPLDIRGRETCSPSPPT